MFTIKSPRRRLARQASLSGLDPYLPLYGTAVKAGEETGVVAVATPEASTSWASQLDPAAGPQQEEDVLELDCGDDEDVASKLLISEDEQEDDIFVTPAQAVQPAASVASRYGGESSTPASALPSSDMLDMCKRAAAQLAIPWPTVIAETTRSRYQGKKLALAKSATKQLLPVFPELLDEVARSWRNGPHSSRSPISGACALAASKVSQFKMPKLSKPQLAPPPLPSRVSWSKKPSASVAAPPAQPTQAAQGRKKKRAALRPLSPVVMQLDVPHSPAPPVWLPNMHPRAPQAPISQLPRPVPEHIRERRTFDGSGFSSCPSLMSTSTRKHTQVFVKKIKCVPLLHPG